MNVLISQNCMIESHTHKCIATRPYGPLHGHNSNDAAWKDEEFTEENLIKIMPYGGIETRPYNYAINLWKRVN